MAQLIKLKRTSVEGRKPTTSNLELGELAINTYDGKIYFEKDNGTPSIREIATEDSHTTFTQLHSIQDMLTSQVMKPLQVTKHFQTT